jgi:hypothetical protein
MLGLGPIAFSPIASNAPVGAVTVTASFTLIAPAAQLSGSDFSILFITTPRPPISLKQVARANTDQPSIGEWANILQVPDYIVSAIPGTAQRIVPTAFIVSRATAVALDGQPAAIALRIVDLRGERVVDLLPSLTVTEIGFTDIPIDDGILGAQEILQVKSLTGDEVHVTVSYVNRTQEVYDVVV